MSKIFKLPENVIIKISDYLNFRDRKNLYLSHTYFSKCLRRRLPSDSEVKTIFLHSTSSIRFIRQRLPHVEKIVIDSKYALIDDILLYLPIDEITHKILFI
jgi:hypothetical protein